MVFIAVSFCLYKEYFSTQLDSLVVSRVLGEPAALPLKLPEEGTVTAIIWIHNGALIAVI